MSLDPAEIRERIEELKTEIAKAQGRSEPLKKSIENDKARLRSLLGCKEGKEASAIKSLKEKVLTQDNKIEQLLIKAEAIYHGGETEVD